MKNIKSPFAKIIKNKRILVTGGTGSIGSALVKKLLAYEPGVVRILSRDAGKQIELQNELAHHANIRFLLGDVRDIDRLMMASEDIDIIFHAAAFKHIPQGEYNPFEVIQTNVIGTQNLITVSLKIPSVTHFVMISTDKAVEPTNTMGASKLLAERLVSATHYMKGKKNKIFTTVRLGNVLGTSGSVLSLFAKQAKGGTILLTHPQMVRFFMTLSDAVNLILEALALARGGEIFVAKMPSLSIKDLAEVYAKHISHPPLSIKVDKVRTGEKLNESLLSPQEALYALETPHLYIIIPQVETEGVSMKNYSYPSAKPLTSHSYDSTNAQKLSQDEIISLLKRAQKE